MKASPVRICWLRLPRSGTLHQWHSRFYVWFYYAIRCLGVQIPATRLRFTILTTMCTAYSVSWGGFGHVVHSLASARFLNLVICTLVRYNIRVDEMGSRDLVKSTRSGSDSLNPERGWYGWKQLLRRKARAPIIALTIWLLSVAAINFAKAYAIIKKANRK